MVVMRVSIQSIRVLGFGGFGNSRVLGKICARRGGLASLPVGWGGGLTSGGTWACTRQRVFRQRLAVFEFEFKSLADRPSPWAMSEQSKSSSSPSPIGLWRHIRDQSAGEAFEQFGRESR